MPSGSQATGYGDRPLPPLCFNHLCALTTAVFFLLLFLQAALKGEQSNSDIPRNPLGKA